MNNNQTPFQEMGSGFRRNDIFVLLEDENGLKKGVKVTLEEDDGTICPWFKVISCASIDYSEVKRIHLHNLLPLIP